MCRGYTTYTRNCKMRLVLKMPRGAISWHYNIVLIYCQEVLYVLGIEDQSLQRNQYQSLL